jgi:hypothetical protein
MLETLFLWFGGAFIVTGLVQWLKGLIGAKGKSKRYIFSLVGAIIAFVAAYFGGERLWLTTLLASGPPVSLGGI